MKFIFAAAVVALTLAACGGGAGGGSTIPQPKSFILNPSSVSLTEGANYANVSISGGVQPYSFAPSSCPATIAEASLSQQTNGQWLLVIGGVPTSETTSCSVVIQDAHGVTASVTVYVNNK